MSAADRSRPQESRPAASGGSRGPRAASPRGKNRTLTYPVASGHSRLPRGHSPQRAEVLITDAEHLKDALARTSGTFVVVDGKEG